ncbi:MAG: anti-sigma factor, partial [Firmicutes bacterium]|nr:anti-sigma factor [Bacillota bacterium]
MTCSRVRALAGAYALDALEAAEREAVERHLDVCPACRAFTAEHADAAAALARLVPPEAPPPELRARVVALAKARRQPPPAATGRAARPSIGHAWHVAAAVALLALGWA